MQINWKMNIIRENKKKQRIYRKKPNRRVDFEQVTRDLLTVICK